MEKAFDAAKRPHCGTRSHTNCSLSVRWESPGCWKRHKGENAVLTGTESFCAAACARPPGASGADPRRAFRWSPLNGSARGDFGAFVPTPSAFSQSACCWCEMPRFYGPCLLFDRPQKRALLAAEWKKNSETNTMSRLRLSRTPLSGRNKPLIAALHLLISFYWLSRFPIAQIAQQAQWARNWALIRLWFLSAWHENFNTVALAILHACFWEQKFMN
jgi:hypothetical protein